MAISHVWMPSISKKTKNKKKNRSWASDRNQPLRREVYLM